MPGPARLDGGVSGRRAVLADLLLIGLVWFVSSRLVLSGARFVPYDSLDEFFPQVRFVVSSLLRGEAPWWNPYQYAGIPVLGDPQSMVFTLHTLVGLLLGDSFTLHAFDITTLAYQLMGGVSLYWYGRASGAPRYGAVMGAIVFMLGGVASSRLQHVPQIVSYSMLPMLLLAMQQLSRAPTFLRALGLGLLGGAFALNPNQVTFLGGLFLLPFAVLHFSESGDRMRCLAMAGLAGLVAASMALPMTAAVLEFVGESNRAAFSVKDSVGTLPPFALVSLILPGLFGVASGQKWAVTDITQDYLYIGAIPGVIVLVRLASDRLSENRFALLTLAAVLAAAIYLLGVNTPIYPWLFNNVPGFSLFRRPADGAYLLNFFLALFLLSTQMKGADSPAWQPLRAFAVLAAVVALLVAAYPALAGFAATRGASADLHRVLASGAFRWGMALFVLWVIAHWACVDRWRQVSLVAVALLVMVDLTVPGRTSDVLGMRYKSRAMAEFYMFGEKPSGGRVAEYRELVEFLRRGTIIDGIPQFRVEIIGDELSYGFPIAVSVPSTQGYNPMMLGGYSRLFPSTKAAPPKRFSAAAGSYLDDWYRRIGLKYVVMPRYVTEENHEQFGKHGAVFVAIRKSLESGGAQLVRSGQAYEVWELPRPDPKVVLYRPDAARAELFDGDKIAQSHDACTVTSYRNTEIAIECDAPLASLLVLSEVVAKGWTACVNEEPVEVSAAGGLLRALPIPAGHSRIALRYRPVPFLRGGGCSGR